MLFINLLIIITATIIATASPPIELSAALDLANEKRNDKKAIKSNGKLSIVELRKQLAKAKKDGNTKLVKRITFVLNTEKGRRK